MGPRGGGCECAALRQLLCPPKQQVGSATGCPLPTHAHPGCLPRLCCPAGLQDDHVVHMVKSKPPAGGAARWVGKSSCRQHRRTAFRPHPTPPHPCASCSPAVLPRPPQVARRRGGLHGWRQRRIDGLPRGRSRPAGTGHGRPGLWWPRRWCCRRHPGRNDAAGAAEPHDAGKAALGRAAEAPRRRAAWSAHSLEMTPAAPLAPAQHACMPPH